ncbi:hypothetical protein [Rhizobium mongolense]|uniref:hypothetical protein n=1 Tax=Rhizobium mongolense TaxID=57676 RepID=UPI0011134E27|nr:hypothetical protein [Rhizobium mongolense]
MFELVIGNHSSCRCLNVQTGQCGILPVEVIELTGVPLPLLVIVRSAAASVAAEEALHSAKVSFARLIYLPFANLRLRPPERQVRRAKSPKLAVTWSEEM